MSDLTAVSRAQLYDSEENLENGDSSQEYALPPPDFDFEIVDVEDDIIDTEATPEDKKEAENISEQKEDDKETGTVEYFPLFSTSTNDDSESKSQLVKVKVDTVEEVEDRKHPDKNWDAIAAERNANARPLSYYFQEKSADEFTKVASVAVDGETILEWNKQFRIESDYKVIDLKKLNATIDLYNRSDSSIRNKDKTHKKRAGKKKRDAKIFKKERLREWKIKLQQAKENAKKRKYKDYPKLDKFQSKKTKFGDSFNKRRSNTVTKASTNNNSSCKPVFRTE